MTPNQHTHTISDSIGVVKFCSLRGEGRSGYERRVKNGVRMRMSLNGLHCVGLDHSSYKR